MKVIILTSIALITLVLLFGCSQPNPGQDNNAQLVGNDADEHGCIASAGYSWCGEKQKCLRIWEETCNSDTNNPNSQIANPASINCIDNGGTLDIIDTNEGQIGMCTLPGGKECEEWVYFRGECTE